MNRGEKRRAAILAAATQVFLAKGFAAATLDDVIAQSGGSRATIYEQFGGKEGLFAAIIAAYCERITVPLAAALVADRPPADVLTEFGRRFVQTILEPESLSLFRVVAAEAERFPKLGRQVFEAGPEASARVLAAYLKQRGVKKPDTTARIFLEMIKGDLHTRALFAVGPMPSSRGVTAVVRDAVRVFVAGTALDGERLGRDGNRT